MKFTNSFLTLLISGSLLACSNPQTKPKQSLSKAKAATQKNFQGEPITSGALVGLYQNAGENTPVVLIVPGSGPTDLNGNNTLGIKSDVYKLLAYGLQSKGISSVRVDKRGMFSSSGAGDPNAVTVDIYAKDYSDWVETIRVKTNAPCVYLLGHSEGALMVSAAAQLNSHICGLILVAGAGRPMGDVLREQLKANPANKIILKDAFGAIETLESGQRVDTKDFHSALKPLFYPHVQGFLISIMAVNPSHVARDAQTKTLVIHGATDLQTSVEDAKLLAKASQGKLVIVEGINHILKEAPLNRRKNFKTYKNPDLPISKQVVHEIADFILAE